LKTDEEGEGEKKVGSAEGKTCQYIEAALGDREKKRRKGKKRRRSSLVRKSIY